MLHLKSSHRLWVLNVTAATLWCLLDGQADTDDLALSYATRFGLDPDTARQDVATLLNQFVQWGLLNDVSPKGQKDDIADQPSELQRAVINFEADISDLEFIKLALAGQNFTVAIADKNLADYWRKLLRHIAIEADSTDRCVALSVISEERVNSRPFIGYENGICAESGLAKNEVVPWLIYKLFDHGMAALNHRLLFHAAVIAKDGRALLLPANSGAGKSTLAAALTATGWTYLSDELAVVDPQTLCAEPFAMPIGLKDKSMAALEDFIPGVKDLPRHIRADGIGLRCFTPPEVGGQGGLPIKALVFPSYCTNSETAMTVLKPLESLTALAATGSSSRPLVDKDVAAMLQLASLPGYRLEFSDLKKALKLINGLFSKKNG